MLMLGVNLPFKITCILGFVGMMSHISNQHLSNCSLKCHKVVQQLPEVILIKPTIPLLNFQTFPASCSSLSRIYEHHVFNAHKCCVWNRKFFMLSFLTLPRTHQHRKGLLNRSGAEKSNKPKKNSKYKRAKARHKNVERDKVSQPFKGNISVTT